MNNSPNTQKAPTAPTVEANQNITSSTKESTIGNANAQQLTVPKFGPGTTTEQAMLAYAKAGFYVLPVDPTRDDGKNPGSLLGSNWPLQSTRDPELIKVWAKAWPKANIALHAGPSGVTVFDVDNPDALDGILATALFAGEGTAYQATRNNLPGRGHYVYANPAGTKFSNKHGSLGNEWGDVRANNGVIIVQPSTHHLAEGEYVWRSHIVQPMPSVIVDALVAETPRSKFTESPTQPMRQPDHIFGIGRGMNEKIGDTGTGPNGEVHRYRQTAGLAANCIEMGYTDSEVLWVLSHHEPTMDKFGARGDLTSEVARCIAYHRPLHDHVGRTCGQAQCENRPDWMDEEVPLVDVSLIEEGEDGARDTALPVILKRAADTGTATPFPTHALRGALGDIARECADAFEVAQAMPASVALSVLSSAALGRVDVNHGYVEASVLWMLGVAAPGQLKSPVMKQITHPLNEAQQRMIKQYELATHEYEIELNDRKKKAEDHKDDDEMAVVDRAQLLLDVQVMEESPVYPAKFMLQDTTPEALNRVMAEQNGRLALITPEGSEMQTAMGLRYGQNATLASLLKMFSREDVDVSRMKDDGTYFIKRPALTVSALVQPDMLTDTFNSKQVKSSGFVHRFLMYKQPEDSLITDADARGVDPHVALEWEKLVQSIVEVTYPRPVEDSIELGLNEKAAEVFRQYRYGVRLAAREERPVLDKEYLAKLPGYTLRLAAALHMAEVGGGGLRDGRIAITEQTLNDAIEVMAFYYGHFIELNDLGSTEAVEHEMTRLLKTVWTRTKKAGKDVTLSRSIMSKAAGKEGLWRLLDKEIVSAAMIRAGEMGLVVIQQNEFTPQGQLKLTFTANHEALKKHFG